MELVKNYKISAQSDLIFAKSDLKNYFKHLNFSDIDFFLFAVMELGTNIIKYPKVGELWLLREGEEFLLASLDKGEGISDVNWALKKGTSSKKTLGLGLYQLSQNSRYKLEILSLNEKYLHGNIVLIRPNLEQNIVYLIKNYLDMPFGGDFVLKKGKYVILADISGHGKRAFKSAEKLKNFILRNAFSCLFIDDFFNMIHKFIKENRLRSVVMDIIEITKFGINICGIGPNKLFVKNDTIKTFSFKNGILGEAFSTSSKFEFKYFKEIFLTTDGIDKKIMYNILNKSTSVYLSVIGGVYFSDDKDDRTVIGVKNGL